MPPQEIQEPLEQVQPAIQGNQNTVTLEKEQNFAVLGARTGVT